MKKYIAISLVFLMCFCLFGCGRAQNTGDKQVKFEVVTDENGIEITVDSTSLENTTEIPSTTEIATTQTEKVETTKSTENTQSTTSTTSTTITQTTQTTPSTTSKPVPTAITCTVSVECKTILNNRDKFTDDSSLIPNDGVILSPTTVTIKEGSTAYDALIIACSKSGVTVTERDSSFGKYIVGINGIDEKDCGQYSGWLYKVNGSSPNVSLSKYTLKNGDNIVLSYTC